MCTVSFIPTRDTVYITSSRDEQASRSVPVFPCEQVVNGSRIMYPRDPDSGGSWIAANDPGEAAVLLNGGFFNHVPMPGYRKSRGIVFMDLFTSDRPVNRFRSCDFDAIAPFTLILYRQGSLTECRWTGSAKYISKLDPSAPHAWSSATLYSPEAAQDRAERFLSWVGSNPPMSPESILSYHGWNEIDQPGFGLRRDALISTVSITLVAFNQESVGIHHVDVMAGIVRYGQLIRQPQMKSIEELG